MAILMDSKNNTIPKLILAVAVLSIIALAGCSTGINQNLNLENKSNTTSSSSLTESHAKAIAEDFIKNSAATYKFDGGNLQFKSMVVQESYPETYVLTYSFMSRQAGYGDRSGLFSAQVMTLHELKAGIVNGKVASAVTDGKYNEITGNMIEQESDDGNGTEMPSLPPQEFPVHLEAVIYQPMQCQQAPWQKWHADGNIQSIKEPTDEELLIAYYSQAQNINVSGYSKFQKQGIASCSACDVCSTAYFIQVSVSSSDAARMENLGWSRVMQ